MPIKYLSWSSPAGGLGRRSADGCRPPPKDSSGELQQKLEGRRLRCPDSSRDRVLTEIPVVADSWARVAAPVLAQGSQPRAVGVTRSWRVNAAYQHCVRLSARAACAILLIDLLAKVARSAGAHGRRWVGSFESDPSTRMGCVVVRCGSSVQVRLPVQRHPSRRAGGRLTDGVVFGWGESGALIGSLIAVVVVPVLAGLEACDQRMAAGLGVGGGVLGGGSVAAADVAALGAAAQVKPPPRRSARTPGSRCRSAGHRCRCPSARSWSCLSLGLDRRACRSRT